MESFHSHRGFTLVELMVVLVIITIVTGVVLASQGSFNKTFVLANTAYDIALTIRSAETFGLGSRAVGSVVNAGYGLHFDSGVAQSFTLFADTYPPSPCSTPNCGNAGDHIYDPDTDTFIQTYTLGNNVSISNLCAFSTGAWRCTQDGLTSLDIVFERPNPDAHMSEDGAYADPPFSVTEACMTITSAQGGERHISVGASGQIITNTATCGS